MPGITVITNHNKTIGLLYAKKEIIQSVNNMKRIGVNGYAQALTEFSVCNFFFRIMNTPTTVNNEKIDNVNPMYSIKSEKDKKKTNMLKVSVIE